MESDPNQSWSDIVTAATILAQQEEVAEDLPASEISSQAISSDQVNSPDHDEVIRVIEIHSAEPEPQENIEQPETQENVEQPETQDIVEQTDIMEVIDEGSVTEGVGDGPADQVVYNTIEQSDVELGQTETIVVMHAKEGKLAENLDEIYIPEVELGAEEMIVDQQSANQLVSSDRMVSGTDEEILVLTHAHRLTDVQCVVDAEGGEDMESDTSQSDDEQSGTSADLTDLRLSQRSDQTTSSPTTHKFTKTKKKKKWTSGLGAGPSSKLFLCTYCDFSAYNLELIHDHTKANHPMDGAFKCPQCYYASDFELSVQLHSVCHTQAPPFKCGKCSFRTTFDTQLNKHINTHTGEKLFKCKICDYGTDHTTNYRRHMERHKRTTGITCDICSYSCFNLYQLQKHKEKSHSSELNIIADLSADNYSSDKIVEEYISSDMIQTDEVQFNMDNEQIIYTEEDLSAIRTRDEPALPGLHLQQQYHMSDDKILKCNQCSFQTKYANNMRRHMLVHKTSPDQIKCGICTYTTTYQSNLRRHYKGMHPGSNYEEIFQRQKVKDTTRMPFNVKRNKNGEMQCPICEYKTQWHTNLRRHYMTHKAKNCPFCSYNDRDKKRFNQHIKTHHITDQEFNCKTCGFNTANSEVWAHHSQIHDTGISEVGEMMSISNTPPSSHTYSIQSNKNPLLQRDSIHDTELETSYDDEICERYNLTSRSLSRDNSRPHGTLQCTECDFTCTHESWLQTHMRQHATGKTDHRCSFCGYTAPNPHRLKAHMMTHVGYKPYKCPKCDFASSNSSNLYRHIRKKHQPEDVELAKNQKVDEHESGVYESFLEEHLDVVPPTTSASAVSQQDSDDFGMRVETTPDKSYLSLLSGTSTKTNSLPYTKNALDNTYQTIVLFSCGECEFQSKSRESLREHKSIHLTSPSETSSKHEKKRTDSINSTTATNTSRAVQEQASISNNIQEEETVVEEICTEEIIPIDESSLMTLNVIDSTVHSTATEIKEEVVTERHVFSCDLCKFSHSVGSLVERHRLLVHYGDRPYKCPHCSLRTSNFYHTLRHAKLNHKRPGTINIPPIIYRPPTALPRLPRRPVQYICCRCNFTTEDRSSWGQHLNSHGEEQLRLLKDEYRKHLKSRRAGAHKRAAERAARERDQSSSLDTKIPTTGPMKCTKCNFTCRRRDMYIAHVRQHSGTKGSVKCTECNYTTTNPYNLMKHYRIHTGEKPFKCEYCTYQSADSGNLNKHIKSHHSQNAPPPKPVKSISTTSQTPKPKPLPAEKSKPPVEKPPKSVKEEKEKKEKEVKDKKPAAPAAPARTPTVPIIPETPGLSLKCSECDYICGSETFLIAHLSLHRKQGDQYVCALCDYSSRNQQNLAKHIRTHTGEKPYACQHCSYCAADKGNLNKHIKSHHTKGDQTPKEPKQKETPAKSKPQPKYTPPETVALHSIHDDLGGMGEERLLLQPDNPQTVETHVALPGIQSLSLGMGNLTASADLVYVPHFDADPEQMM